MRDLLGQSSSPFSSSVARLRRPLGIPNRAGRWAAVVERRATLSQPSLPRPSGPSSTIEVPPPIN